MTLLILALTLTIACAPTYAAGVNTPAAKSAPSATDTPPPATQEPYSGAVYEIPTYTPPKCARVTAYVLNMRETPGGTVIHWLYQYQIVTVTDSTGEWWRISAYGTGGYAHSNHLEKIKCR